MNDKLGHARVSDVQGVYVFTSGVPDQDQEIVIAYAEETAMGWNAAFHTILFNVDDYDENGAIPGRYANITRTSECLRQLAHSTGGRFQWFRETGLLCQSLQLLLIW